MAIKDSINKVGKKLEKTEEKLTELENESVAMQVLHYANEQNRQSTTTLIDTNKRLSRALILVAILWFATVGCFLYYLTHYSTVVTTEDAISDNGGYACVDDGCNNGELVYGESEKSN